MKIKKEWLVIKKQFHKIKLFKIIKKEFIIVKVILISMQK